MIISKEKQKVSLWSGGKTRELYIMPETSDYKALDFDWRLSTATLEIEESVFTKLPRVKRYIMSLTGPLELAHNGSWQTIEAFTCHSFSGDDHTESRGKLTDFNLMTRKGYRGQITAKHLHIDEEVNAMIAYLYKGSASTDEGLMHQYDLIVNEEIKPIKALEACTLILVDIIKE